MIKWLFKYGVVILLVITILLSIEYTYAIGNNIFLFVMVLFLCLLLMHPRQIKIVLYHKAFLFLLIINVINVFYFFLFHSISDFEAIKYLMARSVQFSIISFSIYFNYGYYKDKFLYHFVYFVFGIVLFGLVIDPHVFSGRYSGIIWNPNMFSSLVVMAFSIHFLKDEERKYIDYFILFTLLIAALASGSRGALVAIFIVFIFKYGFSLRNSIYAFFAIAIFYFVSFVNLETSLNRFADQSLFNDRILQFQYGYLTMQENLFTGYGLDKYAYIDKSLVPIYLKSKVIGAHNGYLSLLTQYGIIFGSIILFLIFKKSGQASLYFKRKNSFEKVYFFIIIYTLIASIYESLITGINEFTTILFWFSLTILSYSLFLKDNEN